MSDDDNPFDIWANPSIAILLWPALAYTFTSGSMTAFMAMLAIVMSFHYALLIAMIPGIGFLFYIPAIFWIKGKILAAAGLSTVPLLGVVLYLSIVVSFIFSLRSAIWVVSDG